MLSGRVVSFSELSHNPPCEPAITPDVLNLNKTHHEPYKSKRQRCYSTCTPRWAQSIQRSISRSRRRKKSSTPPVEQQRHLVVSPHSSPRGLHDRTSPHLTENARLKGSYAQTGSTLSENVTFQKSRNINLNRSPPQTQRTNQPKQYRSMNTKHQPKKNNKSMEASKSEEPTPAKKLSETEEIIRLVNNSVPNKCDKYFRMFAGASTHLISLENGVFTLETRLGRRRPKNLKWINIASAWRTCSPVLQKCHTCRIRIYQTERPTGFVVSGKETQDDVDPKKAMTQAFLELGRRMFEADKAPKKFIGEFTYSASELFENQHKKH